MRTLTVFCSSSSDSSTEDSDAEVKVDKYGNTIDYVRLHSDQDSDGDGTEHGNIGDNNRTGCDIHNDRDTSETLDAVRNLLIDEGTTETHTATLETEKTNNNVETELRESDNEKQKS